MDVLIFSINTVLPLVIVVASGFFLKKVNIIDDDFIKKANNLCFKFALPIQLFQNIRSAPFQQVFQPGLVLYVVSGIILMCLVLCLVVPRFIKKRGTCGAFIQGTFRSNFLILGIPLAISMFGENKVSTLSTLLPFVIITYNFLAVIVLTVFSEDAEKKKIDFKSVAIGVAKNPLIIASALGMIFSFFAIGLPEFLEVSLDTIGKLATPLALVILGGQFTPDKLRGNLLVCTIVSILRLIVVPAIFVTGGAIIGYRNEILGSIFIIFAAPSAVSSYIMAKSMNNDHELAGQIVVMTTVFSVVTIFLWTFVLRKLCLI